METKCIEIRKDYFELTIKGKNQGEFERSELRSIIGIIDNSI